MPTARRKLLCSDKNYMFVLMECKAGTAQPPHSHPHTQVDYLLEGEIDMQVGDEVRRMHAGDIVQVPGNVPHAFAGSTGIPAGWNSSPPPERTFCPGKNRKEKNNSNPLAPLVARGALFCFACRRAGACYRVNTRSAREVATPQVLPEGLAIQSPCPTKLYVSLFPACRI